MRLSLRVRVCGMLALLVWPSIATAQSSATGSLNGMVADLSGGVLPGVTVLSDESPNGCVPVCRDGFLRGMDRRRVAGGPLRPDLRASRVQETLAERRAHGGVGDPADQRHARGRRHDRPSDGQRRRADGRRQHRRHLPPAERRRTDDGADIDAQLHAFAFSRGWRERRSSAGTDQRDGQYLPVGERHTHDEHEPLLQRHRRDERHVERRVDVRQHLARAGDARGSQAPDEPLRRLHRPFRRRQLPADHPQRNEHLSRRRVSSTFSTRTSTPTITSTRKTVSTSQRRAETRVA